MFARQKHSAAPAEGIFLSLLSPPAFPEEFFYIEIGFWEGELGSSVAEGGGGRATPLQPGKKELPFSVC